MSKLIRWIVIILILVLVAVYFFGGSDEPTQETPAEDNSDRLISTGESTTEAPLDNNDATLEEIDAALGAI